MHFPLHFPYRKWNDPWIESFRCGSGRSVILERILIQLNPLLLHATYSSPLNCVRASLRPLENEHWLSVQLPGNVSLFYLCIQIAQIHSLLLLFLLVIFVTRGLWVWVVLLAQFNIDYQARTLRTTQLNKLLFKLTMRKPTSCHCGIGISSVKILGGVKGRISVEYI